MRHGQARTPHEKQSLQAQIAATDRQIDAIVYELYGLTADEIRIVEQDQSPVPIGTAEEDAAANGEVESYLPYQPALDAGISPEMDRLNFRRLKLAERRSRGQLTREEEAEFEKLQEQFFAYVNTIFPRPSILDDDRLEKLEKKYGVKHS